ncbi:MAG: hypothetical protein QXQ87_06500 [Halobacteria archaeon]
MQGALLLGVGVFHGLGWSFHLFGAFFLAGGAWLIWFAYNRPWRRPG